jgi:Uma2 family endonuclease
METTMASTSTAPGPQSAAGRAWISYEEFLSDYDGGPAEWVDGEVVPVSPPNTRHARLANFLLSIVTRFIEEGDLGQVLSEPVSMKTGPDLPGRSPDLLFIANDHLGRIKPAYIEGAADLVVEIISPDSRMRDRGEKYYEYEKGGVEEYWLIDPIRSVAEFYVLGDGGVYEPAHLDASGYFASVVLAGLRINPLWLWLDPLPRVPTLLAEAGIVP